MKRKIFVVLLVSLFFLVSSISMGIKVEEEKLVNNIQNSEEFCPVMKLDLKTAEKWEKEYNNAKFAYIDPNLKEEIMATTTYSILDLLEYTPSERNQGRCSNCWAWPSTAVLAMALNLQEGIKDRLSVQFMNTCGAEYTFGMNTIECCEGGTLDMFASFYRSTNFAIPWSNTMAHWHDGVTFNCKTDCSEISKTPNYPIYEIEAENIPTRNIPTEDAIENIKNVLHQEKGVYFSVFFADQTDISNFQNFWREEDEDYVYDLDYYCGNDWNSDEAAGHAMLVYGYHDEEGTENDYWMVLNSWGINDNRPKGLLKWDMHINYNCQYSNQYAFAARTLDVSFDPDPEAPEFPTINGPSSVKIDKEYTFEVSANDPQKDEVYIYVKWDSGFGGSGWLGPVASGESIEVSHTWDEKDNYVLRARAKDTENNIGPWTSHSITMPKSKSNRILSYDFLKQFPIISRLLEKMFAF